MEDFSVQTLLQTPTVTVRDVCCPGHCRHRGEPECALDTTIAFPYRGVYVRHLASDNAVAEANQALFFNAGEEYCISHPVEGGDATLTINLPEALLDELAPRSYLHADKPLAFRMQRLRIDARAQVLVALLRHSLLQRIAEPLEAQGLTLTLAQRALGPRTSHAAGATASRRKLADRVKVLLASNLARRWTLDEIAAEIGGSPVYLTQVFQQVEGMPMYRYHLRLRLARALDLLGEYEDLSALGLDLGFSSHSHFSAAFRQAYGRTPTEFKQSAIVRQ